jgi:putative phosphoribosyl transferase
MLFQDRSEAGRKLAQIVAALPNLKNALVLGLPRGGVPVAFEVARACGLPLDILAVRKLGAPGLKELAVGAVASGGVVVLNRDLVHVLHLSEKELRKMAEKETAAIARDEQDLRAGYPPLNVEGCDAILIDDGIATGATMRAAARAVRPHANRVIIATPVAAASTCRELEREADHVLCLSTPEPFEAVGRFYANFAATSNEEVRALLSEARRSWPAPTIA